MLKRMAIGVGGMVYDGQREIVYKPGVVFRGESMRIPDQCCKNFRLNVRINNMLQYAESVPASLYNEKTYNEIYDRAKKEGWDDEKLAAALSLFRVHWDTMGPSDRIVFTVEGDSGLFQAVIFGTTAELVPSTNVN